jgi:hypothetical protein
MEMKKFSFLAILFALSLLLASPVLAANLIKDGDFENLPPGDFTTASDFVVDNPATHGIWLSNSTTNWQIVPGGPAGSTQFAAHPCEQSTRQIAQGFLLAGTGLWSGSEVILSFDYILPNNTGLTDNAQVVVYGFKAGATWSQFPPWPTSGDAVLLFDESFPKTDDWIHVQRTIILNDNYDALAIGLINGWQGNATCPNEALPGFDNVFLGPAYCVFGQYGVQMAPLAQVCGLIGSNGSVRIGGNAKTESVEGDGYLNLGVIGLIDGNILFNGDCFIGGNTKVLGNVDCGGSIATGVNVSVAGNVTAGGDIRLGNGSSVAGFVTPFDAPAVYTPFVLPPATDFVAGGPGVVAGNKQNIFLPPGVYGNLKLGSLNTLYLISGDYYFDSISIGNGLKLFLDPFAGPINIYVVWDVTFGANTKVFLVSGYPSDIYAETHGSWKMGGNSNWFGNIFAPYGDIIMTGGNSTFIGKLLSGSMVVLDDNISVICPTIVIDGAGGG